MPIIPRLDVREAVLLVEERPQRFRIVKLERPHVMEIREREHKDGKPVGFRLWVNTNDERSIPTRGQPGMRIFREVTPT